MPVNYSDVSDADFRATYLAHDLTHARKLALVVVWAMLPLAYLDFVFHGVGPAWFGLLVLRLAVAGYSAWVWQRLTPTLTAPALDKLLLSWLCVVLLAQLAGNAALPRTYFGHYLVDIWLAAISFMVLPLPLRLLRAPVIGFAAAAVLMLLYKRAPHAAYPLSAVLMLVAAAVTGHASAAYLHRYRHKLLSAEHEIERLTVTDPVTGIANRREFMRISDAELQRHLRQGKPLSVMVLDLDQFKDINDTHGPQAGDIVLVEVTRRVKRSMRNYDSLARYSAEEFCLLLPEASAEDAEKIADRTRASVVAMPVAVSGKEFRVSASIGIATLREGDTAMTLVQRADAARSKGNDHEKTAQPPG